MSNKLSKKTLIFVISIAISLTIGLTSAYITMDSMDLYSTINTPPLSPPSILFPIVWTVLYILMGISSALVIINRKNNAALVDLPTIFLLLFCNKNAQST